MVSAMRQPARRWEITLWFNWRQLVAALLVGAGLLVLGFGLVRPMVSAYIGRQVSRELNEALAREVVAALTGAAEAPPAAPAQPEVAADEASTPQVAAPAEALGAPELQQTSPAAPGVEQAPAQAGQPAAAVDSRSIVRAIVASPPTAAPLVEGQAVSEEQRAAAAEVAQPTHGAQAPPLPAALPAVPTPAIAPPISSPDLPRSVEEVVASLPSGAITVSEDKVNDRIAARAASLGPIDGIVVRFLPGQVQVTLTVLGQDTIGTAGLTIDGGRVVAQSPQLTGALSPFIAVSDLVRPVEDELNAIIDSAGRAVREVRIEQGQIVVTMD